MLYYITGNPRKFATAQEALRQYKVEIQQKELPIIEIQSFSAEEVARVKAEQAYALLKQSLFINDVCWEIPSLQGFPGPYMKYVSEWFEAEDWQSLMSNKTDRRIYLLEYVIYKDAQIEKVFSHRIEGHFLSEPYQSANKHHSVDLMITLHSNGKSVAQCKDDDIERTDAPKLWDELGTFLQTLVTES